MKLLNCILLASLALGVNFAHAADAGAACTANGSTSFNLNRAADVRVLDNTGTDVTNQVTINGQRTAR